MEQPGIRLGSDNAWVELARSEENNWRVTADWCTCLTADFDVYLTHDEVVDFATRMLAHLREPSGGGFSEAVTSSRVNPLSLTMEPVGNGFASFAWLTPNGDDNVCHMQMEMNPVDVSELVELFETFHAALAASQV
ncbi:hypothetical protein [Actinacidiphila bryophytorum]|uniref:Uncharacterized protein n=1 Tax=Actinacidiphila bryophytorum TaxID=1436133 RepID=A0A9W4E3T9_9ACTN|nr:hypothetical protein [Actinacidiphila bryophytorum]MBM9439712.1 hypothetical protein [Actinacidiphila bryophytorum]MBN6547600.1 hypothetical protein [Actinacidiphila bryophytorum]CAG7605991.1 conserved hypothetical protein [Actinacidiphila bryophytorum]